MCTRDRILSSCALRRNVVRTLMQVEVGDVVPGPALQLGIPPHVALLLRPWVAVHISGGAVIDDAAVQRPRPAPFGSDPTLLLARSSSCGLVLLVRKRTAVDPAAAGCRAVGFELRVTREGPAFRVPPIDLAENGIRTRLSLRAFGRVIPFQVEQRPFPGVD